MSSFLVLFASAFLFSQFGYSKQVQIKISEHKIGDVYPEYLSVAIDTAYLIGGKWWDEDGGETNQPPVDLKNENLIHYTKMLGPTYLRIGGSEADKVYLAFGDERDDYKDPSLKMDLIKKGFKSVLTEKRWEELQDFLKQTNKELYFTINVGYSVREKRKWQSHEFEKLLKHVQSRGDKLPILEFGNEVNAFYLHFGLHRQIGTRRVAKEFIWAREIMEQYYPEGRLSGAGFAIWPKIGNALRFFSGTNKGLLKRIPDLDILSWHYYPAQSPRCGVFTVPSKIKNYFKPKVLNEVEKFARRFKRWRDKYNPNAELWMSETGPAQCGGKAGVTDTYASSFWWIDQLGILAKHDTKVVVRQAMVGADYGLLDFKTFDALPDYWTSALWRQYMGTEVFDVELIAEKKKSKKYLRAYAHSHPEEGKGLVIINLSEEESVIKLPSGNGFFSKVSADTPDAKNIYINKQPAGFPLLQSKLESETVTLKGRTINFFQIL